MLDCYNAQPLASGIQNLQGNATLLNLDSIHVNLGDSFSFEIEVTDPDTADSVTIFHNISAVLPGVTIVETNGNPAILTVGWRAPISPNNTNIVTITAVDDRCMSPGIATKKYVIIVGNGINSVKEPEISSVSIYPNPTTGILYLDNKSQENVRIEIMDMMGKVIYSGMLKIGQSVIDIQNAASGLYVVRIKTRKGFEYTKVVNN